MINFKNRDFSFYALKQYIYDNIEMLEYSSLGDFTDIVKVKQNGKYGIVNFDGEIIFDIIYDEIIKYNYTGHIKTVKSSEEKIFFKDGTPY